MADEQNNPSPPEAPAAEPAAERPAAPPASERPAPASRPQGSRPPGSRPPGSRPPMGRGGPRGPRSDRPGSGPAGPRRGKRQFFRKKKVCRFCADRSDYIDYKKADVLRGFVQERGKILPRRMTGTCSRHQRWLGEAIKRARNIALLPFATGL